MNKHTYTFIISCSFLVQIILCAEMNSVIGYNRALCISIQTKLDFIRVYHRFIIHSWWIHIVFRNLTFWSHPILIVWAFALDWSVKLLKVNVTHLLVARAARLWKNHNHDYFGQYWNHNYSNDLFWVWKLDLFIQHVSQKTLCKWELWNFA